MKEKSETQVRGRGTQIARCFIILRLNKALPGVLERSIGIPGAVRGSQRDAIPPHILPHDRGISCRPETGYET